MGKIFDHFEYINYENEADVNHKFVIPFLTEFLGLSLEKDIYPERNYPAKDLFYGIKSFSSKSLPSSQRPDFVICIDDISNPKFVLESKAPTENLEQHLNQMKSYALGVGVNLLVITNGKNFRIYNVNDIIFQANDISELDIRFDCIEKILSKKILESNSTTRILQRIDLPKSLGLSAEQIADEEKKKIDLEISDFKDYLQHLQNEFADWQIPREFHSLYSSEIVQYPPNKLHKFQIYEHAELQLRDRNEYTYEEVDLKFKNLKVILGESGIGKTTLLKYLCYSKSTSCLKSISSQIPVYIPLRQLGPNTSLKDLIMDSLGKRGFNLPFDRFFDTLRKNSFLFLLDAYDEVQENYLEEAKRQIEDFTSDPKYVVYVTSRVSRPLFLSGATQFVIKSLEQNEIDSLLEKYFGGEKFKFWLEIKNKGLTEESKNTLLLTLMILIYKDDSCIPSTRNQIIKRTIEKIKEWEQSKGERLIDGLTWEIKEQLFSKLAFKFIDCNRKSYLSKDEIDDVLLPFLEKYEQKREIPKGIAKNRILDDLALTGIVSYDSNQLTFWHNIFLDYFASKELAVFHTNNPEFIEEIKDQILWEPIIIGSVVHMEDSTELINILKEDNLFLASACLIESQTVDECTIQNIVLQLSTRCFSPIALIRFWALYYLKRIDVKYTKELFFDLVEKKTYPEIRIVALEEISKLGNDIAKSIVYKYIDWDERAPFWFYYSTTQGSIAKALSNFDEDEYLKIIDIWKNKMDIFTSGNCKEAILNIHRNGKLTEKVKEELLNFYIETTDTENEISKSGHTSQLSEVLIEINDESFIPILIKNIDKSDYSIHNKYTEDILASYQSEDAINQLVNEVLNKDNEAKIIEVCSAALSESKGIVSLTVFTQLLDYENFRVRGNAVKGLGKFSSSEIKSYLLEHLNDKNSFVQGEILKVLGDKGLLTNLLHIPFNLYNAEVLLHEIQKFKLKEMLPIVNLLKNQINNDDRLLVNIAYTFCIFEETEKAKKIVNEFLSEDRVATSEFTLADLAKIAPSFDASYSLLIIEFVLKSIDKFEDIKGKGYWEELCIKALEKMGDEKSIDMLKELATDYASQKEPFGVERALRSINILATNNDEDWYIHFINSNPTLGKIDLGRAIEGLGYIGSKKSIPIIRKIAILNKEDSDICNTCFKSLGNIYRIGGVSKEITEIDLF